MVKSRAFTMKPTTVTLPLDDLMKLLKKAAATGRNTADTAVDFTDSGIAYHVFIEYAKGNDNGQASE